VMVLSYEYPQPVPKWQWQRFASLGSRRVGWKPSPAPLRHSASDLQTLKAEKKIRLGRESYSRYGLRSSCRMTSKIEIEMYVFGEALEW
jgi:hypothetical protein